MKNKKGFTLVELLVVIAIIGLLSTLSVIALNSARGKSRDARRIADIKQVQTALELYYNEEGGYPTTVSSAGSIIGPTASTTFMAVVPTAPTPADGSCQTSENTYTYTVGGTGNSTYTITYCLGATTGGLAGGTKTATPAGVNV